MDAWSNGSTEVGQCQFSEWDAFLAKTPGGNYAQTTLWAAVKSSAGYQVERFALKNSHGLAGGAQVLLRKLPLIGTVAYVPLGPVIGEGHPELVDAAVRHLTSLARERGITYLAVQPPQQHQALTNRLRTMGFVPGFMDLAPTASLVIDLSKSLDELLAEMHRTTRYNVRHSQRKGISVREGCQQDLQRFHSFLRATARRHGNFKPLTWEYLQVLWRLFSPGGHLKMFVAEYQGQAVSAALLMNFGDTAIYWKACWSGEHGGKHPNEALQWTAIQWAKAKGYHYYDFGGIPRRLAESILHGDGLEQAPANPVASYKLGFGGRVVLFPEPLVYARSAILRRFATSVPKQKLEPLKRLVNQIK